MSAYDFQIKGLNTFKRHRPLLNLREAESLREGYNTTKIIENCYIRNKVLEALEDQSIGRLHNKLARTVFGSLGGVPYGETGSREEKKVSYAMLRKFYYEISRTPPEFTPEALERPLDRDRIIKYLKLKNSIVYYPIPIMIYTVEDILNHRVRFIFTRDLVGGEPAPEIGLPGGRDIDYFIVLDTEPDANDIFYAKWLEAYLDNLVGSAIISFMLKEALLAGQKVDDLFTRPYNEIINHNIVEIHLMSFEDASNYVFLSKKPIDGYEVLIDYMGDRLYGKAKALDVKLYDITKYKMRIDAVREQVKESMGIPLDESRTFKEFDRRLNAAILEKKIKFNMIDIEE